MRTAVYEMLEEFPESTREYLLELCPNFELVNALFILRSDEKTLIELLTDEGQFGLDDFELTLLKSWVYVVATLSNWVELRNAIRD